MNHFQIVTAESKSQVKAFIDFPHDLYEGDINYVPELFTAQRNLLTRGKHPFHEHSEIKLFLAYNGTKILGRIAAILNNNHNNYNKTNDGFFGFFDCINDEIVSALLFDTAATWLRKKNVSTIQGPVNPSTNETCGLLIEGFDEPPVTMLTYNKPYYSTLIEKYGFSKKVDLLAWDINAKRIGEKSLRIHEVLKQRLAQRNITIRKLNIKDFDNEITRVMEVYNAAWDKNFGFVPMTSNELAYMAKEMKMIVNPEFCLIAEHEGKAIAFGLALPNINQILIKIKRGRLFPVGILKILFGLKKITHIRVIALGVLEKYRRMGIEACFHAEMIQTGIKTGLTRAECSWVLEHNDMSNKSIEGAGGKMYKKYRIYEKAL